MRRFLSFISLLLTLSFVLLALGGCTPSASTADGTTPPPKDPSDPKDEAAYDLVLRYDDRMTLDGSFVRVEDTDTKDPSLLSLSGSTDASFTLRAAGVGSGSLRIRRNGEELSLRVLVKPSPLHVLLMLGEDAAAGNATSAPTPRAADGLVYYTATGAARPSALAASGNAAAYIPAALAAPYTSAAGSVLPIPVNELTTSGAARFAGLAAPIAYQYAEATGARVWMLNLAERGSSINDYCPRTEDPAASPALYRGALALWEEAARLLRTEIDRGHYTLASFGFFFCGGESDAAMSEDDYYHAFACMKEGLDRDFVFEDGTRTRRPDFGGLILPRAGRERGPAMNEENGPRTAIRRIGRESDGIFSNVYLLATEADNWDTNEHIAAYFSHYDYRNFALYYGYAPPKTLDELFYIDGSYTAAACNELGYVAVRALLASLP